MYSYMYFTQQKKTWINYLSFQNKNIIFLAQIFHLQRDENFLNILFCFCFSSKIKILWFVPFLQNMGLIYLVV